MSSETFVNYREFRWLWINLALLTALLVIYYFDAPLGGSNGGTVLGYSYGVLATLGIGYLMWFGIRKRAYYSSKSTLKGCLGAHIWLGIALSIIVPLHCGFSFGWNVHTLAYGLMLLTIITGVWGAILYLRLPPYIHSHRGRGNIVSLLEQLATLANDVGNLVNKRSDALVQIVNRFDIPSKFTVLSCIFSPDLSPIKPEQAGELLGKLPPDEQDIGVKLMSLLSRRMQLANQVREETRTLAWLKIWLYFHLLISFGLCAAVLIHIFSVFFNW